MTTTNREKQQKHYDYKLIREKALRGPRITSLLQRFEKIASGEEQKPKLPVIAAQVFLDRDGEYKKYHQILQRNMGTFAKHGLASIPFMLEEVIRIGVALHRFAEENRFSSSEPLTFYETSSADGTIGRSLAEYSNGLIKTLTDSPNESNRLEFNRLLTHNYSYFHKGPFVDITPQYLSQAYGHIFKGGFDIIWENTTFQMYGNNRDEQIAYVSRLLKEDGLMIFHEKMNHFKVDEYKRLEKLKDDKFKSQYFNENELKLKKLNILSEMEAGQVTLSEFRQALKTHFKYAYIIWNSCNFYEIVASNNKKIIESFISYLPAPYVLDDFIINTPIVCKFL